MKTTKALKTLESLQIKILEVLLTKEMKKLRSRNINKKNKIKNVYK